MHRWDAALALFEMRRLLPWLWTVLTNSRSFTPNSVLPFTPSLPCSPYVHILLLSLVYLPYANSHLPPPLYQTRHSFITSIPFISKWGLLVYVSTIACPLKSGMFRSHLHLHLRMCLVPEKWLSYHKASSQKFPET